MPYEFEHTQNFLGHYFIMQAHNARQFTDTGTFTLRCGTCQIGVKGAKEAQDHAKTTGHTNFQEYS